MQFFHKITEGAAVQPILHKIMRNRDWWDQDTSRTAFEGSPHQQASDILLRCCVTDNRTLAEAYVDLESVDRDVLRHLPEAKALALDLMRIVSGSRLGRMVVTRLPAGAKIALHSDEGPYADYYQRYHVVLQGLPGAVFICGDEAVQMATGEIWWTDVKTQHAVNNNSKDDRIHLIVDIRTDP